MLLPSKNFDFSAFPPLIMSKIMHNLVVLVEPSKIAYHTSLKGGNMILNRFCIDEDAAFELSRVNSLEKTFLGLKHMGGTRVVKRKEKGKV